MNPFHVITKRLRPFKYYSPASLEEAAKILQEYDGGAKVLAGGTDLLPMMKLRAVTPECVVNLKGIAGLNYIRQEGKELRIGALTPISALLGADFVRKKYLSVYEAATVFGTPQVRNMATIGGNICRSSPSADMVPPLMSLGTVLTLVGVNGERRIALEHFFTGAGQNKLDREILSEIVIPSQEEPYGTAFAKLSRNSSDLAKVNCAAKIIVGGLICEDVRIILGAVADRPIRAKRVEAAIKGKKIAEEVIERASKEVKREIIPISDARSTAEYRMHVSQILIKRVIMQAMGRAC